MSLEPPRHLSGPGRRPAFHQHVLSMTGFAHSPDFLPFSRTPWDHFLPSFLSFFNYFIF